MTIIFMERTRVDPFPLRLGLGVSSGARERALVEVAISFSKAAG
ncbi:hypothetical protein L1889_04220 [Paenalcaligenes niemegkensis]|nr:hypothetical protein [Paenalcaligenes niemegkensis]MCQ9616004.1 hypothetical protein [Paenalcaligenes niemegkensis]